MPVAQSNGILSYRHFSIGDYFLFIFETFFFLNFQFRMQVVCMHTFWFSQWVALDSGHIDEIVRCICTVFGWYLLTQITKNRRNTIFSTLLGNGADEVEEAWMEQQQQKQHAHTPKQKMHRAHTSKTMAPIHSWLARHMHQYKYFSMGYMANNMKSTERKDKKKQHNRNIKLAHNCSIQAALVYVCL